MPVRLIITVMVLVCGLTAHGADDPDQGLLSFDDSPGDFNLQKPPWFKMSLLELGHDLEEALDKGKSGLIIYFHQPECAYCKTMQEVNLSKPDLVHYVTSHFDVIALNIFGDEELTDPQGNTLTVKEYAIRERTHFTPSLIFYGADGSQALKLRGYYPPYKMRAALEYVADGHYQRMSYRDYLARAEILVPIEDDELIPDPLFSDPPYALDRSRFAAPEPLLVIFEQARCHACDVLHAEPLQDARVRDKLEGFEIVQLSMWDDETPVLTPGGHRTTPFQWGRDLELFYTPTLVFFDEHGSEVIRVDSVIQFDRLNNVLDYVLKKGYLEEPLFQRWRRAQQLP
ncbi:MAG: thioredoxin fold domain-containing protein [Gammaproteobacteria bacterium]|nr:thioredoxin fold domain-containing protein [Gammaproteobacteria bacterium]